ncbi:MAG: pimeloyl-ACP methyl ester carboxylesterase [Arenicella sp.]
MINLKLTKFLFVGLISIVSAPILAKSQGEYPASVSELKIVSHTKRMPGIAYLAAGQGPHPTVLLLHGYPGNEKNLDVAQALRRLGWNVVFFHYRGAWGSEGEFSYRNAEQDVQVVLQYMSDAKNAQRLRIDPLRISIVGHSMGGHMALAGIVDNPSVKCAVAYDGANMGANGRGLGADEASKKMWKDYGDSLFMLNGWSGTKAQDEIAQYGAELDLVKRVKKINGRPILLIPADTDVIPMDIHIQPLVAAIEASKDSQLSVVLINDDHSFSSSRQTLIETTAKFLKASCQ